MKKLISLLLAAAMCSSIALSGCGSQNNSVQEDTNAQVQETSVNEKVFVYPIEHDIPDLTPSYGEDSRTVVIRPLYDYLYIINNGETRYYLVDKMEESADGLNIKLHFNESAKWHDGEPVTVEDLLFTLKYLSEAATKTDTELTKVDGEDIIYEKIDTYTVNITLPKNLSKFTTKLGRLMLYPAHVYHNDPTAVEGSEESMLGIGNGPFKLEQWNKGENFVYVKNENYYRKPAKIDKLIMKIIPEDSAKEVAFQSGEISFMRLNNKEKYEKYAGNTNYNIYQTPECRVNYLQLNPMSEKISSKEARQAIFHAINLDEIMDTVYGSEEMSKKGKTVFCDQNKYFVDMENYSYDLEKAQELAKKSGLNKVTLKYIYNNDRVGMPEVAVIIQQQLKAAGIDVELQAMDSSSFFSMFFAWASSEATSEWDLGTNGWDSMQGDPSTQIVSYAHNDTCMHCSEETVSTLDKAIYATTEKDKKENFEKFQKLIQDDYTVYPISCPNYVWVTQKGVTGLDTITSMIPFEDWTLIDVA